MEIIGQKFNRWTVLRLDHHVGSKAFYACVCECGTNAIVRKDQLTRGVSKSCGCWKKEVAREQIIRLSTTHGMANKTRTYGIWKGIHKRCENPNDKGWKDYGGRGIKVCDRWRDYELFLRDMGEAPPGMSLEREDNDGNYEPGNCHWATTIEQSNNKRSNVKFKFNGRYLSVKEIAREIPMPYHTLWQRLYRLHWPFHRAITP